MPKKIKKEKIHVCKKCKDETREEILKDFDGMCEECFVEINGDVEEEYPEESFGY